MSASLRKSLSLDMPALAEMLRSKGRGKDTVLAHITPQEAALLKKRGGRGSRNPDTGLLEFDDSTDTGFSGMESAYDQPISNSSGGGGQDFGSQLNAASGGGHFEMLRYAICLHSRWERTVQGVPEIRGVVGPHSG